MKCTNQLIIKGKEIPCGGCLNCLENRRAVWTFRIIQELDVAETARFVTLTYDEKHLPWINEKGTIGTIWPKKINERNSQWEKSIKLTQSLHKADLQKFLKECRNKIMKDHWDTFKGSKIKELEETIRYVKKSEITGKWSPKLRYFACGEYGTTGQRGNNPHYHIIIFNIPRKWYKTDPIHNEEYSNEMESLWNKGMIKISGVVRASAHYVAKYTIKSLNDKWKKDDIRPKPFAIMSKNPGIGNNYINDENRNYHIGSETYHTYLKGGYIQPIGRYYKEKIFVPKKKTQKFKIQTEIGETTIETPGIRKYSKEETNAKRKIQQHVKNKENAQKEQFISEEIGDINEGERLYYKRERENNDYRKSKALIQHKKLGGKL